MSGIPMRELVVAHSSDTHIDGHQSEDFHPLCKVIEAAHRVRADVLLLAGDVFDHNRVDDSLVGRVAYLLSEASIPIVILPGNHDCLVANSVYYRGIGDVSNVHVIGVQAEAVIFPEHDLEVWGRAHTNYADMSPLREPRPRSTRWQIAMAHGQWWRWPADYSAWEISSEEIVATSADYVALGHWPQAMAAGDGQVPAYYSGSPDLAGTVNVVRLTGSGSVDVRRVPLVP